MHSWRLCSGNDLKQVFMQASYPGRDFSCHRGGLENDVRQPGLGARSFTWNNSIKHLK